MRQPSHTDPTNHVDHPLDFHARHAWDLYLNPWWGLRFLNGNAERLAAYLTTTLGQPRMQWQGCFNELVWGDRERPPRFNVSLSGGNGSLWFAFSLPWGSFCINDLQNNDVAFLNKNYLLGGFDLQSHFQRLDKYAGIEKLSAEDNRHLQAIAKHYGRTILIGCSTVGDLVNKLPSDAMTTKINPETPELGEILARYKNVPELDFSHEFGFGIT